MADHKSRLRRVWIVVKWIQRGLTVLVLVILAVSVPPFWRWSTQHNAALLRQSHVVSTAKGDIEVAVVGEGVPILQLHGSPGGYDQPLVRHNLRPNQSAGLKAISISRPGYLRTPLASGRTHQEQADLYFALLETLGLRHVIVQGSSGGSYSAIQFVLRHPDRAIALILYAPDLGSQRGGDTFAVRLHAQGWLIDDYSRWLLTSRLIFPFAGPLMARDLDMDDDDEREVVRTLIRSTIPAGLHSAGRRNDLEQRANPEIDRWPVERIRVPTLIVHGTRDENASYQRSVALSARIPGAKLVSIEGGDHLVSFTRPDEVRRAIDGFIDDVVGRAKAGPPEASR
jgi:pimeloyl-ACP methyl ester carboxylesterase